MARMEAKDAGNLAGRLLAVMMEEPKDTDAGRLSWLAWAMGELVAKMGPKDATSIADRLLAVLEDPKETNAGRLSWLGWAMAEFVAKMGPKDATSIADRLLAVLEDPKETNAGRLSTLGGTLAELATRMEPKEAAAVTVRGAQRLVGLLEDPKNAYHLSTLGGALAELVARMEPKEAAAVAVRGAQRLAGLLEDPKETNAYHLSTLGGTLAELVAKMEPKEAAAVAVRGAQRLARLLEDPKETGFSGLGLHEQVRQVFGTLSLAIPVARQTQLLALSHMLVVQGPMLVVQGPSQDKKWRVARKRNTVISVCERLAPQDLADVLKWPFALVEAESIVLASLEKKTGKAFAGDVWKFVEQAEGLGIKDIELPAKRPRVEDALKELDELRDGTAHRWRPASEQ